MVMKTEDTELNQLEKHVKNGRGEVLEYLWLVRKLMVRGSGIVFKHGHSIFSDSGERSARGSHVGLAASKSLFTLSSPALLSLWVLAFCLTVGASSPAPVLTIKSPDGDVIDCVNREDQPAFRHPLLKTHKIQEPPRDIPYTVQKEVGNEYIWQIWHRNGTKCPEGSIPIRRVIPHPSNTSGSYAGDRVTKGHEHAVGRMRNRPKIYGTQATMNVWHPTIEKANEFSLGQIWLVSGSYNNNDINSIEAGWQIYPWLYHDYQPRFFIYWTTDTYNQTGCYNLRCGGFVQTSSRIVVEGAIAQTSVFGGTQVDLTIKIWKDQKLGSWWLGVVTDQGMLEPVGYWPTFIFTLQRDFAERVEWGGEIVDINSSGRTQMGSGCYPGSGVGKVAYMRNLEIALSENVFQPVRDLQFAASRPDYYIAKKLDNASFYYGGPDKIKSKGVHLSFDYISIYFGFQLFLYLLV